MSDQWVGVFHQPAKPYQHEDISSLAKSLKKQLAARSIETSHVELLNMLAKAVGAQNYQSWLAQPQAWTPELTQPVTNIEKVRFRLVAHQPGLSLPAPRDSNSLSASRIYALLDVDLHQCGFGGTVRLKVSVDASLFPAGQDAADWLRPYAIPALADLAAREPHRLSIFGAVTLSLDRHVAEGNPIRFSEAGRFDLTVELPGTEFRRLSFECAQARKSLDDFNKAKEKLWEILGMASPAEYASHHANKLRAISLYLENFLEAEGDLVMGQWSDEKLGAISDALAAAAEAPSTARKEEWETLRQSVFAATAPKHWNVPVFASRELFADTAALA